MEEQKEIPIIPKRFSYRDHLIWFIPLLGFLLIGVSYIIHRTILTYNEGTELRRACWYGRFNNVKSLVEKGVDINLSIMDSSHPIYGSISQIYLYITTPRGADEIYPTDDILNKLLPIHWAAQMGHYEIVEYLLEHGALPDSDMKQDIRPIRLASYEGHLEIVDLLLQYGAVYQLFEASAKGDLDFVLNTLKVYPELITERDNKSRSPLFYAARNGNVEMCKVLISKGVDISARSVYGSTALGEAIERGHLSIVKLLINHVLDLQLNDLSDKTLIMLAIDNNRFDIADILLTKNKNLLSILQLNTAFLLAVINNDIPKCEWLLSHGADINHKSDLHKGAPIHYAAQYSIMSGTTAMYDFLVSKGADLTIKNVQGLTGAEILKMSVNSSFYKYQSTLMGNKIPKSSTDISVSSDNLSSYKLLKE